MHPYRPGARPRKPPRTLCPKCKHLHSEMTATSRVGRFSLSTPVYRARYTGAPLRPTRAEAHNDMCEHLQSLSA